MPSANCPKFRARIRSEVQEAEVCGVCSSLIHDPNAGGDVEVQLQIAGDGLYIFDRGGKRLNFWPYADMINAIPANGEMDHVLAHHTRRDITLTVGDDGSYATIAIRAPQLRQPRERLLRRVWEGVPEQVRGAPILLAFVFVLMGVSWAIDLFD
jgi:hypothetical protein